MKSINELIKEIHQSAIEKGFYEERRNFGELIALIHSELSEVLEEYRNHHGATEIYYSTTETRDIDVESIEECIPVDTIYKSRIKDLTLFDGYTNDIIKISKPEGIPIELADVVIRIFDLCGYYNIDLEHAIEEKMTYNKTRPHKHGGKRI